MRATILIAVMVSILVSGFASAGNECGWESTVIDGTIYIPDATPDHQIVPVNDAEVEVTCYHGDGSSTEKAASNSEGHYSVMFDSEQCDLGDQVSVIATHPSYGQGDAPGNIEYHYEFACGCEVNVGIVDVPLIPEFGLIIGGLTVISAIAVFFVIRRH